MWRDTGNKWAIVEETVMDLTCLDFLPATVHLPSESNIKQGCAVMSDMELSIIICINKHATLTFVTYKQ